MHPAGAATSRYARRHGAQSLSILLSLETNKARSCSIIRPRSPRILPVAIGVLLVAREPASLEPVGAELAVAGLRTRSVTTFDEALAQAAARDYDVAIIAAEMPHPGGAELVERLKQVRPRM